MKSSCHTTAELIKRCQSGYWKLNVIWILNFHPHPLSRRFLHFLNWSSLELNFSCRTFQKTCAKYVRKENYMLAIKRCVKLQAPRERSSRGREKCIGNVQLRNYYELLTAQCKYLYWKSIVLRKKKNCNI